VSVEKLYRGNNPRMTTAYLRALLDGPHADQGGELLDREEQLALLRWRQEHILAGVERRIKGGIDSGREPFEVLVDCQDHVVGGARAWVDLVVLEPVLADTQPVAAVLERVAS
jgi:acyl-CoA oxidase